MNPIQIAAKFYEARDTVKALWPEDWRERIAPCAAEIRTCSRKSGWDTVMATLHILKFMCRDGKHLGARIYYLAAAAEIMEPS